MPFFSDFSRKNNCSNAHILSKNRPFSEKNLLLWPYYVKNTSTVVFVLNTPSLVKSDFQNIASDALNTTPLRAIFFMIQHKNSPITKFLGNHKIKSHDFWNAPLIPPPPLFKRDFGRGGEGGI